MDSLRGATRRCCRNEYPDWSPSFFHTRDWVFIFEDRPQRDLFDHQSTSHGGTMQQVYWLYQDVPPRTAFRLPARVNSVDQVARLSMSLPYQLYRVILPVLRPIQYKKLGGVEG